MPKYSLSDEDIVFIWESYQKGMMIEDISKGCGVKTNTVSRIIDSLMEVDAEDVAKMRADREKGKSKYQIADENGYSLSAVRYYLTGIKRPYEDCRPRVTFAEDWEATCRRLNEKAWEGR